jgi:tetrahydromethanopterin S-methyltransferase subunit G
MSEAAKLLFEEKNKQLSEKDKSIAELKERVSRLEEKLETKDCEIVRLKGMTGGLEVQILKIELTEVTVRLEERDK